MPKRHLFVEPQLGHLKRLKTTPVTEWELCIFCQTKSQETLQCPANINSVKSSYTTLANILPQFEKNGHIPMNLDLQRLDDGSGLEATLWNKKAKWHKRCLLKFNQKALQRQLRKPSATLQSSVYTRSSVRHSSSEDVCFFCDQPAGNLVLHEALSKHIDQKVRRCAQRLGESKLLAKLAAGDMIAIHAKYHGKCLTALYNRVRAATPKQEAEDSLHGICLAELVAYIEEMHDKEDYPVFKLSDLVKLYRERLMELGGHVDGRIHSSRLKMRLLYNIQGLQAHAQGRDVLLTFEEDVGPALQKACDHDDDALHLMRAAKVIRKDVLETAYKFDGCFQSICLEKSVPASLMSLVEMILAGVNIISNRRSTNTSTKTAANTISQLMVFNSTKHTKQKDACFVRHSRIKETPVPLYLALKVHAATRCKGLVDTFFHLGLSISYDRMLHISSDLANSVCNLYKEEGVVCPPKLRKGLFTMGAVDNVDHNPSSTTAKTSFHGTAISLMQIPSSLSQGTERGGFFIDVDNPTSKAVNPLPDFYTSVPPAAISSRQFKAPPLKYPLQTAGDIVNVLKEEYKWLKCVEDRFLQAEADTGTLISWAAFHASKEQDVHEPAISALLPLFPDTSHSVAMIHHAMTVIKAATQHVNPGQIPVVALDQPLYALAKEIQWTWPDTHGEDHFVIMFGGLHIEMCILKLLGKWLDESGWTSALVQAGVATKGTAETFLRGSHVTKCRHAHQVTVAALHVLLSKAYKESTTREEEPLVPDLADSFDSWITKRCQDSIQFLYWFQTLSLQLLLLAFIRAIRTADFNLYKQVLIEIIPWLFALDHTHYSRWLSVHVRDMMALEDRHPEMFVQFSSGNFVIHKTRNRFSAMAIDQYHEQNICRIKGSGGAIGLTENPSALRRWMIAGPEIGRIIYEFEHVTSVLDHICDNKHHESQPMLQSVFSTDVKSLVDAFEDMGNPFLEESQDLIVLDTRDIKEESVCGSIRKAEILGRKQYIEFVQHRLTNQQMAVTDTIAKNNLPLFSSSPEKTVSKEKAQLTALKKDCNLFSRLYVACQVRDGNIDKFFSHENQAIPPALSQGGTLRLGNKSDLLPCIETEVQNSTSKPTADAFILDGAAVIHLLNPATARTFQEYTETIFMPYIFSTLTKADRVDIVWDVYRVDSLKGLARRKRGKGQRRRVLPSTSIPKNWKDFLREEKNKSELFVYLSAEVVTPIVGENKQIYATQGNTVISSPAPLDISNLAPCTHEEADTRVLLHAADAAKKGFKNIVIRSVDTDILVLAVSEFEEIQAKQLWVALGTGSKFRYVPVHEIVATLGPDMSTNLSTFHAFTGCDTVSAFAGRGKKTAWETWKSFPDISKAFKEMRRLPRTISEQSVNTIERFVVLMYDRTSNEFEVNTARKHLFTQRGRTLENIPPTKDALLQHTKRACLQAFCWDKALVRDPPLPSPSDWGWLKADDDTWQPIWTTLPEAEKSCYELIHCSCKKACTRRCSCFKAALKCTALCACSGDCLQL